MSVLGDLTPDQFLGKHWQRQPLLVRNAVPDYTSPVSPDELAGLALDAEVESRLVLQRGDAGPWELKHGPFQDSDFAELPELVRGYEDLKLERIELYRKELAAAEASLGS